VSEKQSRVPQVFSKKRVPEALPPPLTEVADHKDQLLLPPRKADPTFPGGGASCDSSNEPQPNQQASINRADRTKTRCQSCDPAKIYRQEMAANPAAVASAKTSKLANPKHKPPFCNFN